jgi:HAD superfamily hydrolase (TIGR01509 family)
MTPKLSVKGVIFDLDGTLIDSMHLWDSFWMRWMEKLGFPRDESLYSVLVDMTFTQSAHFFIEHLQLDMTPEAVIDDWVSMITAEQLHGVQLKPGAAEFLDLLDAAGIPYGVLTACLPPAGRIILAEKKLSDRCRFIFFTDELGWSKTSPEPFLHCADALGIPPQDCLVFEDSLFSLQGASLAGMALVAVFDQHQRHWEALQQQAFLAVMDFYEVIEKWETIAE